MTTADVLRAAKALIPDRAHWSSNASGNLEGFGYKRDRPIVCMSGAVYVAANGWRGAEPSLHDSDEARAAHDALGSVVGDITAFNDADGRTIADVHEAFDKAIARAEA